MSGTTKQQDGRNGLRVARKADWRVWWEHTHYLPPLGAYVDISGEKLAQLWSLGQSARANVNETEAASLELVAELWLRSGTVQIDRLTWDGRV